MHSKNLGILLICTVFREYFQSQIKKQTLQDVTKYAGVYNRSIKQSALHLKIVTAEKKMMIGSFRLSICSVRADAWIGAIAKA